MWKWLCRLPPDAKYLLFLASSILVAYLCTYVQRRGYLERVQPLNDYYAESDKCTYLNLPHISNIEDLTSYNNYLYISNSPSRRIFSNVENTLATAAEREIDLRGTSYFDRFSVLTDTNDRGSIYVNSLDTYPVVSPYKLPIDNWDWDAEPDFHPLGIDIISEEGTSNVKLRVLYETRVGTKLAQFHVNSIDERPISLNVEWIHFNDLFTYPTHIQSVDTDTFYIVNKFHGKRHETGDDWEPTYEKYTMFKYGNVLKCTTDATKIDGDTVFTSFNARYSKPTHVVKSQGVLDKSKELHCYVAIASLGQPNDIALLRKYNLLLVTSRLPGNIMAFSLDTHYKMWELTTTTGTEHISVTNDTNILITAHAKLQEYKDAFAYNAPHASNTILQTHTLDHLHRYLEWTMLANTKPVYLDPAPKKFGAISAIHSVHNPKDNKHYFIAGSSIEQGLMTCQYEPVSV